jgi:hypothetical protein
MDAPSTALAAVAAVVLAELLLRSRVARVVLRQTLTHPLSESRIVTGRDRAGRLQAVFSGVTVDEWQDVSRRAAASAVSRSPVPGVPPSRTPVDDLIIPAQSEHHAGSDEPANGG